MIRIWAELIGRAYNPPSLAVRIWAKISIFSSIHQEIKVVIKWTILTKLVRLVARQKLKSMYSKKLNLIKKEKRKRKKRSHLAIMTKYSSRCKWRSIKSQRNCLLLHLLPPCLLTLSLRSFPLLLFLKEVEHYSHSWSQKLFQRCLCLKSQFQSLLCLLAVE